MKKKKWSAKVGWATTQIVLQYMILYCDLEAARVVKVYCRWCWIVLQPGEKIVLQDGQVYCNRGSMVAEETVLQYSLLYCDRVLG